MTSISPVPADPARRETPALALPDAALHALRGDRLVLAWCGTRGILACAAARATEAAVAAMVLRGRGLTCFSVRPERAMELGLVLAGAARDPNRGAPVFLRSVEAAACDGTGISAADRALTLRAAGDALAGVHSLRSPGHVIPVMVPVRGGNRALPAAVAIELLAAADPAGPRAIPGWTDVLDDDGELAGRVWCEALASRLGLPFVEAG